MTSTDQQAGGARLRVGIIVGSTRPGRIAPLVAEWVADVARAHGAADYHVLDIADFSLPLMDEVRPSTGRYRHEHTKVWSAAVAECDAFIFVAPEYNHSISSALKNALDFLYLEWQDKSAGVVVYGRASGGARAGEHLRQILGELRVGMVRQQVLISMRGDHEGGSQFDPGAQKLTTLHTMLDQLVEWGDALRAVRASRGAGSGT